jgi:hypothetical protein
MNRLQAVFSFSRRRARQGREMRNTVIVAVLALAAGLGAGWWFASRHPTVSAQPSPPAVSRAQDEQGPPASGAGTRDFANEAAIAAGTATSAPAVALAPAAGSPPLPPPPPRPASPTENRLLGAHGLRAEDMQNALMNPHYGQLIDSLSREASADSLEMTRIYRDFLASGMKADPRFRIERMACGAHLCVLSATGPVGQDDAFANFLAGSDQKNPANPKVYAVMPGSLPPTGSATSTEYRMIFTIDPKFNGFEAHF